MAVTFQPPIGSFDAGDRVQYNLTLRNNDKTTTAHDLSIVVTFEALDTNRIYITCSRGSPTFNDISRESTLFISSIAPSQSVDCNYTSFLQSRIIPERLISQTVAIEYYSVPPSNAPQQLASYKERQHANFTTEPINTTIVPSQNAEELQAGDPVNFTLHLQIPECVTNLTAIFDLPSVPLSVIDLSRRKRDASLSGIDSEDAGSR